MLLGAIMGLLGSIIPEGFKVFRDWQDKKHELKMIEMQMKYQREMTEMRIQEARAIATLEIDKESYKYANVDFKPTGQLWIDVIQVVGAFYNQSVRPTLTYLVIACWLLVKYSLFLKAGGNIEVLPTVWTDADNEFVAAVVMFWFGGRAFSRTFKRI